MTDIGGKSRMSDRPGAEAGYAPDRFHEYAFHGATLSLWTLRAVLSTVAVVGVVSFFLGLMPLMGFLDERAFGYLGPASQGFDEMAKAWLVLAAFGGVGVAVVWVLVSGAANVAFHRQLAREWADPARRLVPVAWQRQALLKDPLNGVDLLGLWMVVAGWFMVVIGLIAVGVVAAEDGGDGIGASLTIVGAFLVLAVAGGFLRGFVRRRGSGGLASAPWHWTKESMTATVAATTAAAGRQVEEPLTAADRLRSSVTRWMGWGAAAIGLLFLAGLVVTFVRKPGRHAEERSYGPSGEQAIDTAWQVIVVALAVVVALSVLVMVAAMAYDLWRTAGLAARLRRDEPAMSRPPAAVLERHLEGEPTGEPLGRGLVAVAAGVGAVALGALLTDAEVWGVRPAAAGLSFAAEDVHLLARVVLGVCAVVLVLGIAAIVVGFTVEARWRNRARTAWPLLSELPKPARQEPGRPDPDVPLLV